MATITAAITRPPVLPADLRRQHARQHHHPPASRVDPVHRRVSQHRLPRVSQTAHLPRIVLPLQIIHRSDPDHHPPAVPGAAAEEAIAAAQVPGEVIVAAVPGVAVAEAEDDNSVLPEKNNHP